MTSVRSIGLSLAACAAMFFAAGCSRKPAVTVEQVYEEQPNSEDNRSLPKLHPPKCGPLPEAEYPEILLDGLPKIVSVRIDLIIDTEGRATRLNATVLGDLDVPEEFVEVALSAAGRFDCLPALQMPSPESDRIIPTAVEYASSIIYRFHLDEKSATVSF